MLFMRWDNDYSGEDLNLTYIYNAVEGKGIEWRMELTVPIEQLKTIIKLKPSRQI